MTFMISWFTNDDAIYYTTSSVQILRLPNNSHNNNWFGSRRCRCSPTGPPSFSTTGTATDIRTWPSSSRQRIFPSGYMVCRWVRATSRQPQRESIALCGRTTSTRVQGSVSVTPPCVAVRNPVDCVLKGARRKTGSVNTAHCPRHVDTAYHSRRRGSERRGWVRSRTPGSKERTDQTKWAHLCRRHTAYWKRHGPRTTVRGRTDRQRTYGDAQPTRKPVKELGRSTASCPRRSPSTAHWPAGGSPIETFAFPCSLRFLERSVLSSFCPYPSQGQCDLILWTLWLVMWIAGLLQ